VPIRVGVIGTGFAAARHADALRRLPSVQLVGIASGTRSRAIEAARRLGAEHAFRDALELIEDPGVDAVHICTINRLHAELSAAALRAGKHVVTEKPLSTDRQSAEMLARVAEDAAQSGTVAAVCFNYRHYSLIQQLRAMLASGEHGPVHFIHGSYLQDWLLYDTDWNWRLDPASNGTSRAIADIGSHWIDLVQHVSGQRITAVLADLETLHAVRQRPATETRTSAPRASDRREAVGVECEDFGSVIMRFTEGARGTVAVSQVSSGRKNRLTFQIDTSEAAVAWDQEHPDAAWMGRRRLPNLQLTRDPVDDGMGALPSGHPEGWRDALYNLCADFYGAVEARRNGQQYAGAFATFADGHQIAEVVEAILESNRTSSWVGVSASSEVRV
jgi:predicted dehydrogenase